jgi:hypothetical protein
MRRNIALVLVGLIIGCGAGAAATQRATAQPLPAGAPQGAPMTPGAPFPAPLQPKWQQFCEQTSSVQEASALAAMRGADGFELVALYNGVLCFKRPLSAGGVPPKSAAPGWPGY